MEKIPQSISKELPIVAIYLDEIKEIVDLLENNKQEYGKVTITTKTHKFNSISELSDLPEIRMNQLKINLSNPYISVDFDRLLIRIYSSTDEIEVIGIVSKLEEIILRGKRPIANFIANSYLVWIIPSPIGLVLGLGANILKSFFVPAVILFGLIILLILFFSFKFSLRDHSTIFLSFRNENQNFWVRNKDQIVVQVIVGIIILLVGIGIGKVF